MQASNFILLALTGILAASVPLTMVWMASPARTNTASWRG
jgi:hypothetical protein